MALHHRFPVDERAVPRVAIPASRLEAWKEVAREEITRALTHPHSWYNAFGETIRDGFSTLADRPQLKAFVRSIPGGADKNVLVRATLDDTSLEEIAHGLRCESTYDARCAFAHMYEDHFLDGGLVQVHEPTTDAEPMSFVGVKWIAFRSPAPALVASRDFIFFAFDGVAHDAEGRRVYFRFLRSMPMDGLDVDDTRLPPQLLVRGKISNLNLYRQNGSHVEVFTMAMHSNAGTMPSVLATKTISILFPGILNLATIADARALMEQGATGLNRERVQSPLPRGLVSPASSLCSAGSSSTNGGFGGGGNSSNSRTPSSLAAANACGVCYHKFKLTRSKRPCHGCARTVCKRCTKGLWFFDGDKDQSTTGVARLRFCLNCIRTARTEAQILRSEPTMATTRGDDLRFLVAAMAANGGGGYRTPSNASTSSSVFLRIPSSDNVLRKASYDEGPAGFTTTTPRYGSSSSMRTPTNGSLPRAPSPAHSSSMIRLPSQAGSAHSSHSSPTRTRSTTSSVRSSTQRSLATSDMIPLDMSRLEKPVVDDDHDDHGDLNDSDVDDLHDDLEDYDDEDLEDLEDSELHDHDHHHAADALHAFTKLDIHEPALEPEADDEDYYDTDNYSIAGSFCLDGALSFLHDDVEYDDETRGTFIPLKMTQKAMAIAAAAVRGPPVPHSTLATAQSTAQASGEDPASSSHSDNRSLESPPRRWQHQLPPQPQLTPSVKAIASRIPSAPNLLSYSATKRTNRPGGIGTAPPRPPMQRAVSAETTSHHHELAQSHVGFRRRVPKPVLSGEQHRLRYNE